MSYPQAGKFFVLSASWCRGGNVEAVPAEPPKRPRRGTRSASEPVTIERPTEYASVVEVRRSSRRRRTVSAYREGGGRIVVLLPARMSAKEEEHWVAAMLDKLAAQENRGLLSESELSQRAVELSERYLEGRARPTSVRWVTNQNTRWGSCTPAQGSIRISHRLQGMPDYVIDYVLLHELAHLLVPGHGADFWRLLSHYPRTERARGFLEGISAADRLPHVPSTADR